MLYSPDMFTNTKMLRRLGLNCALDVKILDHSLSLIIIIIIIVIIIRHASQFIIVNHSSGLKLVPWCGNIAIVNTIEEVCLKHPPE